MSTSASTDLIGQTVDRRYTVLEHLADGGMASVYVALDERLDRRVALKIMRRDLARDDAFVARFRREARSAARLTHPNVVAVTDQGRDGDLVFLAMELVHGQTLRQVIRDESPMPPGQALDIMDAVLAALAAAHRAGLVHRDIKPENVLIGQDGGVKVADFGLARAVTGQTLTTDSDVLLGTAAYFSPEQVEHGHADARSDVYSAALLLFELLTGRKAFPGDTPINIAYQHVHGALPVASDLVPTVPADLDELIALGAAKDPDTRPADAGEYLTRLRHVRRGLTESQLDVVPERRSGAATTAVHTRALTGRTAEPEAAAPTGGRRHRRLGRLLIGMLIAAALAAAWLFTLGPLGRTTVPATGGQAPGHAITALHRADLQARVEHDFSEKVPAGTVIGSSPADGDHLWKNGTVVLHVSKGPERHAVPRLAGTTLSKAEAAITRAHLSPGRVHHSYDLTVPAGQVIRTDPTAGTSLRRGATVALTVSDGPRPVTVPDVTGQPKADAKKALTDLGLKVSYADPAYSSSVVKGNVVSQSPGPGGGHAGDTITLTVSKGPQMVTVPDVVSMSSEQATSALEAAGLKVKVDRYFGGLFDKVRAQSAAKGTSVPIGSTITISVV